MSLPASSTRTSPSTASQKIQERHRRRSTSKPDEFGIPVLPFEDLRRGPGRARPRPAAHPVRRHRATPTPVSSSTARSPAGSSAARASTAAGRSIDKIPMHYNIGHLTTVEGDTVEPRGKFLIGAQQVVDRPLLRRSDRCYPQNFQLIDIGEPTPMQLLYDMPIGIGEPHYAQIDPAPRRSSRGRSTRRSAGTRSPRRRRRSRSTPARRASTRDGNNGRRST